MKKDIRSLNKEELKQLVESYGEKSYRAEQIFSWLHKSFATDFSQMTNISKALRDKLNTDYIIDPLKLVTKQISDDRNTIKYLFSLPDDATLECVWMRHDFGDSLCISSQVGCRMGCTFCASTINGLERNLSAGEMLSQIYDIEAATYPNGESHISNVIVMGMGEPFDNFDALIDFLRLVTDKDGRNLSARGITVSTCGLEDGIRRLADEKIPVTLALSLHAANERLRECIMPIARSHPLDQVLDACEYYFKTTGRRITWEYSLMSGVNDSLSDADELSLLADKMKKRGTPVHINLIPLNPVKERDYVRSDDERINSFKLRLEKNRINVTIRREMGGGIDAACGQLRKNHL